MSIVVEFFDNSTLDLTPAEGDSALIRGDLDDKDLSRSDFPEGPSEPPSERGSRSKAVLGLSPSSTFIFP